MQNASLAVFMAGKAPRKFTVSPAVAGKTTWDLDVDGPFNPGVAGSWTITPLFDVWSLGKSWGGAGAGATSLHTGGAGGAIVADVLLIKGVAYTFYIASGGGHATTAGVPGGASGQASGEGSGGYSGIRRASDGEPIIIAGGGGGSGNGNGGYDGGAGGGLAGEQRPSGGVGGTQTVGTPFQGQAGFSTGSGAGGGGYRGGACGSTDDTTYRSGGGGGSGYANPLYTKNVTHYPGATTIPGNSADPDRGTAGDAPAGGGAGLAGRTLLK